MCLGFGEDIGLCCGGAEQRECNCSISQSYCLFCKAIHLFGLPRLLGEDYSNKHKILETNRTNETGVVSIKIDSIFLKELRIDSGGQNGRLQYVHYRFLKAYNDMQ
ncbi:hypothetical protein HOE425_320416 [Hoeflea sp. EC-HK425]|nr:hypothetical protein HOE425_320416 [Hoeflea sp. EC-HK425]